MRKYFIFLIAFFVCLQIVSAQNIYIKHQLFLKNENNVRFSKLLFGIDRSATNGIDTALASKIKENMFVFEDLLNLDTEYVMKILQNVDAGDVATFLVDFGRFQFNNPCSNDNQCNGDCECDTDVDADDVTMFLQDFGRFQFNNPCPVCVVGDWCVYP